MFKWKKNYRQQAKSLYYEFAYISRFRTLRWVIPLSSETKTVLAQLIAPTSGPGRLHQLNTLSTLTCAAGSEALYEAGVQVSRGQWLVFSEDLLARYV